MKSMNCIAVTKPLFTRFFAKVTVGSGCWVWTGYTKPSKYGAIKINRSWWRVHRIAYLLYFGYFDERLHVLHRCDNPSCVRPTHLFLGTHDDNMRDMVTKGRARNRFTV